MRGNNKENAPALVDGTASMVEAARRQILGKRKEPSDDRDDHIDEGGDNEEVTDTPKML